jgi:3-oxoacyl-[acyl-carrier-protein] synthase-3
VLYLHGLGHFHPDNVIDNAFLEALDIDTTHQWIIERVGIIERRTILSLDYIRETRNQDPALAQKYAAFTDAQTGAKAAHMALERAGLRTSDIGMLIAGGCRGQYSLPSNACVIAAELEIEAESFDINSACSTFAAQMHVINRMKPELLPDYILLVIPENWTMSTDYRDRKTAVLMGDCSVAAIVSPRKPSPYRISYTSLASNPANWDKVVTPAGKHFMQDGKAVQKFAIKKTVSLIEEIQKETGVNAAMHYFIGHQANLMMLQSVSRILGIAAEKHLFNVDVFGNCAAAGAPSVLSQNWEKLDSGDKIVLVVVGAGLSWGGMLIEKGDWL